MMFVCIARDSGGIRSAGRSPSSRGYLVAEAESRAIDIISSPQPRIKKLPPVTGLQTTDRFIGRSICGRTRELAHDGLATKKNDRVIALSLSFAKVIPAGWSVSAPDAHRGHFFRLTLHSLMRFSTLKFQGSSMHDIAAIYTMQPKNNSSLRTRTAR